MGPARAVEAGSCHCGAVRLRFSSSRPLGELPLRLLVLPPARGARTVADPAGALAIRAAPGALNRYRFGLGTADFLLCARCGTYVAALVESGGRSVATLNANALEARDCLDPAPPLVNYEGETAAGRIARRLAGWTPATVTESMTGSDD